MGYITNASLTALFVFGSLLIGIQLSENNKSSTSVVSTNAPSPHPTAYPSVELSAAPSAAPSDAPSAPPSTAPSVAPSTAPSAAPSVAPTSAPTELKPHIVFVMVDDLGYNDLGYMQRLNFNNNGIGTPYQTDLLIDATTSHTPHIDQLADEGMKLTQYYTQTVCSPTRASLLTGLYPSHHGVGESVVRPCHSTGISTKFPWISQILKAHTDYSTYFFGKTHVGTAHVDFMPTNRGFDYWFGSSLGESDFNTHYRAASADVDFCGGTLVEATAGADLTDASHHKFIQDVTTWTGGTWNETETYDNTLLMTKLDAQIKKHNPDDHSAEKQGVPSFTYIALRSPHEGYHIWPTFNGALDHSYCGGDGNANQWLDEDEGDVKTCCLATQHGSSAGCLNNGDLDPNMNVRTSFIEMVKDIDDTVGRIKQIYETYNMWDNTIFIFSSDNGALKGRKSGSNLPLVGYKKHQQEGGFRVPAFVRGIPGTKYNVHPGASNHLMHVVDWYKTIASLSTANISQTNFVQPLDSIDMSDKIFNTVYDDLATNAANETYMYSPRDTVIHAYGHTGEYVIRHKNYQRTNTLNSNSLASQLNIKTSNNKCLKIDGTVEDPVSASNCDHIKNVIAENYDATGNILLDLGWQAELGYEDYEDDCYTGGGDAGAHNAETVLGYKGTQVQSNRYWKIGWDNTITNSDLCDYLKITTNGVKPSYCN